MYQGLEGRVTPSFRGQLEVGESGVHLAVWGPDLPSASPILRCSLGKPESSVSPAVNSGAQSPCCQEN